MTDRDANVVNETLARNPIHELLSVQTTPLSGGGLTCISGSNLLCRTHHVGEDLQCSRLNLGLRNLILITWSEGVHFLGLRCLICDVN